MELHSLGVGNYSESDVKAAAHSLTGFGVNRERWSFHYDADRHDPGEKTFLGQTGNWSGDDVVQIICDQPACANFIARKLLEFFVYQQPEPALVTQAAGILRSSGYDFRKFFTLLFSSQLFYSAQSPRIHRQEPGGAHDRRPRVDGRSGSRRRPPWRGPS